MKSLLTHRQIDWAYEKWCEGYTYLQIAEALYVCEKTILRALHGRPRIRPVLHYSFDKEDNMKEKQILVVIKEPGKEPRVEPLFDNTLEAFQKEVGGYIETVTVASDLVLICNEEGRLRGLPYNLNFCGVDFVGTVIAVGVKRDEFCSIKSPCVPFVINMLKGETNG